MALFAQIDCSFPDRPDIAEAGDLAELVYMRAVLRCRDNLTDGVIDRRVVSRWFAGIRGKSVTHLEKLVSVGLLNHHPDGWCIPIEVWTKWNPTKADVQEKRAAEAERVRAYREKKYARTHDVRTENVQSEYAQPEPEPEPEPITLAQLKPKTGPSFDEFWMAYPRKTAKAKAQAAWRRLSPKDRSEALDVLPAHCRTWTDPQYTPHASTWLNGRRWEDDLKSSTVTAKPKNNGVTMSRYA